MYMSIQQRILLKMTDSFVISDDDPNKATESKEIEFTSFVKSCEDAVPSKNKEMKKVVTFGALSRILRCLTEDSQLSNFETNLI